MMRGLLRDIPAYDPGSTGGQRQPLFERFVPSPPEAGTSVGTAPSAEGSAPIPTPGRMKFELFYSTLSSRKAKPYVTY
jgi:hypothetical protein